MAKWNVDNIYSLVKFLTRKNQSGGISPKDFFYSWNSEQTAMFNDLLGRWQNRNNGKTGANTGLIMDETIMQILSPFVVPETLTITAGKATKPTDFVYELGLRINDEQVNKINHGQIFAVKKSVIDPPSIADNKYYSVEYEDYYYFLPDTVELVDLDYIKQPIDIVWGFVYNSNNRPVYNAGTSVQPVWKQNEIVEITKRTLTGFGVSYKDKDFEQFGKTTQLTGD